MVFGLGVGISIGASFGSDLAIQMFNEANTLRILCEPNIPDICYEAFVGVDAKPLGKP